MPPVNREQLVNYIKSLETKVKQFQDVLKKRDAEIIRLRTELKTLVSNKNTEVTPELERKPPSPSPVISPTPAPTSSESPPAASAPPVSPTIPQFKLKTKPLEERPKSFIMKADAGADERAKQAVQAKETPPTPSSPPEPPAEPSSMSFEETADEIEAEIPSGTPQPAASFVPSINFNAGEFLSAVIDGEEEADEIKALIERLEKSEPDQRRNVLLSLTSVYWRMTANMAKRMIGENLSREKRLCMRYGMLDEKLMSSRMDIWEQLYLDKSQPKDTGIYFVDEWYEAVIRGDVRYSTIDEFALNGAKPDPKATGALALSYEIMTVPQMQRLCVGPRANMIAVLVQDFCAPSRDNPIVNRQWLPGGIAEVLSCDYTMFHRKYKGEETIVKPLFIICPGYGQRSGCWEPYTPGRKGDTGPRIPICAFPPRSSLKALIIGISDYRWEYAKADSMHYWLTEGLTGKWIALFNKKEQRKDLKVWFQESYMHWVVSESNRIPKLEKRFREFLWVNCPFSDKVKERLKGGGMFGRLIELEDAKKQREEAERVEIERIKAEREARKAKRLGQQEQLNSK